MPPNILICFYMLRATLSTFAKPLPQQEKVYHRCANTLNFMTQKVFEKISSHNPERYGRKTTDFCREWNPYITNIEKL